MCCAGIGLFPVAELTGTKASHTVDLVLMNFHTLFRGDKDQCLVRRFHGFGKARILPLGHFVYKAVCPNGLIEHEFDHVLVGQSDNTQCIPNPTEVSEVRWESLSTIHHELISTPHIYTPWFAQALHIALNGNQCSDI